MVDEAFGKVLGNAGLLGYAGLAGYAGAAAETSLEVGVGICGGAADLLGNTIRDEFISQ